MDERLKYISISFLAIFIIVVLFFNPKGGKNEESVGELKNNMAFIYNKDVDTSDWISYSNQRLGFSMKIPPEITCANRCSKDNLLVPVKIIEDGDSVYIVPEHYYDLGESGKCEKIVYDIGLLKKQQEGSINPFLGWKIDVASVSGVDGIDRFVKDNFGESCSIGNGNLKNEGLEEISIVGTDWPDLNSSCSREMHYKIIYSSESRRVLSVKKGIDYDFYVLFPGGMADYGPEMLKSIDFK
ncbi:MAG: hypothetical protein PHH21_02540 [Candidatus Pacebacteria bacterium]|nr:hypothetical protein [Candidatus Paceibacterota bacterium]